jgi:ATP-binding cassette subfamily B protein
MARSTYEKDQIMQISASRSRRNRGSSDSKGNRSLGRALRYIGRYPKVALVATAALLVATAAQLAVPQLVQNILDTITGSAANKFILDLPANVQQTIAQQLGLNLVAMQADLNNATRALLLGGLIIVAFAIARGLFAFVQTYSSQALSQNIAFDLRNDLYEKIQRLSVIHQYIV